MLATGSSQAWMARDEDQWELLWAPYDESTYQPVLAAIQPEDVVLEIGAGDLRLARRMAKLARRVEAIEIQADLFERLPDDPANLIVHSGDAQRLPFPKDVSLAVLLMRHCQHFRLYAEKLRAVGCRRLATNARWRMGVEIIDLFAQRQSYLKACPGWYACWCGAVGFKPGPVEEYQPETDQIIHEINICPDCCPVLSEAA
ncbi:MAG: hypothetical protein MUE67_11250 [Anaerolineales bacterium]|jgi:hypothetical protein|nr:hypothetical protein [Anaerolineales bacterium]